MSELDKSRDHAHIMGLLLRYAQIGGADMRACLLYTSDAADE